MGKKLEIDLGSKSGQISLEPIKGASSPVNAIDEKNIIKQLEKDGTNVGAVIINKEHSPNKTILPHLDHTPSHTPRCLGLSDSIKDDKESSSISEVAETFNASKKNKEMTGSTGGLELSAIPTRHLDESVFTFRPKVSVNSRKIVENLGSDFMTRQQQHIQRHQKIVSVNFSNDN